MTGMVIKQADGWDVSLWDQTGRDVSSSSQMVNILFGVWISVQDIVDWLLVRGWPGENNHTSVSSNVVY